MKYISVFLSLALMLICGGCENQVSKEYPHKNIFLYIFSSQGGSTDIWARYLSKVMEDEMDVKFICNNLPGANGGLAAMKVWNAPHDGYTVLGASETSLFFGVNDVAPMVDKWDFYIAVSSSGVIAVLDKSPYNSIQDLVNAAKKSPGLVKISNSGMGKLWHIKAVQFEQGADVKFQHIPYNGSAPAISALLSKEVDAVSCSAEEIHEYVRSGLLRPLVITETEGKEITGHGFVKSAADIYPKVAKGFENLHQWIGFLLPHDVPDSVKIVFGNAFKNAISNPVIQEQIKIQKVKKLGLTGKEAKRLVTKMQSEASWISNDLGIAKRDPRKLGIPKNVEMSDAD